jgi:two-component system sensor histidine kinase PhcS
MVTARPAPAFLATERTAPQATRLAQALADPHIAQRFQDEDRVLTLRNVRILCWIAMALVPVAVVLDYFAYPHLLRKFALLRVSCSLCLIPVLLATRTWLGQRYYRAFTVLVPMIPAFFISLMIREASDPGTSYYAGLTLCLVAIGFMFHWTFIESAVALGMTMAFYLLANAEVLIQGVSLATVGVFVNNCVFILLNGVVIISGSFYHHRIRVREFLTRIEVEQQREELEASNQELTSTLQQLRETENQLFQSEKLASLGRMSAGIIHEINNPLNFTNQAIFVLKKKSKHLPDAERMEFERIVADIKEGIGRVSSIVSDLRGFSHPDSGMLVEVCVATAVQSAVRLMSKEISDQGVELEVELPDKLTVRSDQNQLVQVLINLIHNAVDAMKGQSNPKLRLRAQTAQDRTTITVSDNGCGIPAENLAKIFDPFFTTKEVGEGMGLGLSVSFRMMNHMQGGIDVSSVPGTGTDFTLWFPPSTLAS